MLYAMQYKTCKHFAVTLTPEEKATCYCPGANSRGDPAKKTYQLDGKLCFEPINPDKCPYYFPVNLRFREWPCHWNFLLFDSLKSLDTMFL